MSTERGVRICIFSRTEWSTSYRCDFLSLSYIMGENPFTGNPMKSAIHRTRNKKTRNGSWRDDPLFMNTISFSGERSRAGRKTNDGYSIFLTNATTDKFSLFGYAGPFVRMFRITAKPVLFPVDRERARVSQGRARQGRVGAAITLVSNISAHKVFIKQRRTRVTASGRASTTARMIYDRRELSFRRVGLSPSLT